MRHIEFCIFKFQKMCDSGKVLKTSLFIVIIVSIIVLSPELRSSFSL